MRQGVRSIVLTALAVVVVSAGAAYGAAGQPLVLGQSNSAGSAKTSLTSTTGTSQVFNVTGTTSAGVIRALNKGTGYGLDGETTNGDAGVFGGAVNIGVKGVSSGSSGIGVYGQDTASGAGVNGTSAGGDGVVGAGAANGVHGVSGPGNGVYGNSSGLNGVQGISGSNTSSGVYGQNNGKGYGVAGRANNGVGVLGDSSNGWAMQASGNVTQSLGAGGWAKAMALINGDGTVARCFNSQETGSLVDSNGCGINVSFPLGTSTPKYKVDFGFDMTERFESVTTFQANPGQTVGDILADPSSTAVDVYIASAKVPFFIIVY